MTAPLPAESSGSGLRWGLALIGAATAIGVLLFARSASLVVTNRTGALITLIGPLGDSLAVASDSQLVVPLPRVGFARVVWRAGPWRDARGRAFGVEASGEFTIRGGRGRVERTIGLGDARIPMFAPLITNATGEPLRIVVNDGLRDRVDCACQVPPDAVRIPIGFYPLFANSTVRATAGAGRSALFRDLGREVEPVSGLVSLRFQASDLR